MIVTRSSNSGLVLWIGSWKDLFDVWRHLYNNWERKDWISCGRNNIQKPIVGIEQISSKNWVKMSVSAKQLFRERERHAEPGLARICRLC